jgi:hypothetical protein
MDYRQKIKEYRARIKNERTLHFVEFLDILFEWIDGLYENKRLRKWQEKDLSIPIRIFEELDAASPTELSTESYLVMKKSLLDESAGLIRSIIRLGNLKMSDFDLVQFNLSGVFKKEEIASMMEWARLHMVDVIREKKDTAQKAQEDTTKADEAWLQKINGMTQQELTGLIMRSLFDFTPSARTPSERVHALALSHETVSRQRKEFHDFENKLMDAATDLKGEAQERVYRQLGEVKLQMDTVTDQFRKKARKFVSDEGPKKQIGKAQAHITLQKAQLHQQLEGVGKEWQQRFSEETSQARKIMQDRSDDFRAAVEKKRRTYTTQFGAEIEKARTSITEKRAVLSEMEKYTLAYILERGETEMSGAELRMITGKEGFESDVEHARHLFSGKDEEIGEAREDFTQKRDVASAKFIEKGVEIETEMYNTLYRETRRFEREKFEAQDRFRYRAGEIKGHAEQYISGKKGAFQSERDSAQMRFMNRADEIKGKPRQSLQDGSGEVDRFEAKAGEAKSGISRQHKAITKQAKVNRDLMEKGIIEKKNLFLYDVRFAQHSIKQHATSFSEGIAAKKEEFDTKQKQIVARHKATQKTHIIRTLLRTIRTMH